MIRVIHQLLVRQAEEDDALVSGEQREEFMDLLGCDYTERRGLFEFYSNDDASRAESLALERGLHAVRFYRFVVNREDIIDYPGFYLSLGVVETIIGEHGIDHCALAGLQIAKDINTESILIHRTILDFIMKEAWGTSFREAEKDWYVLENLPVIVEPIWICKPVFIAPNDDPPGSHVVQSDGRDCLSYNAALQLQQSGLCCAQEVETSQGRLSTRKRHLISPQMLSDMVGLGVVGILHEYVPLLDKERPNI